MPDRTLKIGMIGAGEVAGAHARVLQSLPGAELAYVHCRTPERRVAFARAHGAEAVSDSDRLIEQADAVIVCCPGYAQAGYSLAALRAGKAVLSEKPGAVTLEEARQIADLGRLFQIGFNRRFAPLYQRVAALLESSIEPSSYVARIDRGELAAPGWVGDRNVSGGYGYETVIHLVDLLLHLFGPIARLEATFTRNVYDEGDNLSVLLEHESGVHGVLSSCAHATWIAPFEELRVHGRFATLQTAELSTLRQRVGLGAPTEEEHFDALTREERWGFTSQLQMFVDAVLDRPGRPAPPPGGRDLLRAVETLERIYAFENA